MVSGKPDKFLRFMRNHDVSKALKALIASPYFMIYISDNDKKQIQWCNDTMKIKTGYSLSEMKKKGKKFFEEIMHPDDIELAWKSQKGFHAGKQIFAGVARIKNKKTDEWNWITGFAISLKHHPKLVLAIFFDVNILFDTAQQLEKVTEYIRNYIHGKELNKLTPTERVIMNLLSRGKSHKEIAAYMNRSLNTVRTHISHLKEKFGVHSTAELVAIAHQFGLDG